MKDFTIERESAVFRDTIKVTETTDTNHADNINYAPKQIFENTVANAREIGEVREIAESVGGIFKDIAIEIKPEDWHSDGEGSYPFYHDITDEDITDEMIPNVILDEESLDIAAGFRMCATAISYEGYIRVKAKAEPTQTITGVCHVSTMNGSAGGGGGSYVLRPATKTRLGGVKIGDGLSAEDDGTTSVDRDSIAEDITEPVAKSVVNKATSPDEDVDKMLEDVFDNETSEAGAAEGTDTGDGADLDGD